jgi:hypothetical protein
MNTEIKITKNKAETVYINHPNASYGIFCFNKDGDLFLNSDWGLYGYGWRAYGKSFKGFLSGCNAEYIVGKFAINYREVSGKKMPPYKEEKITILVETFIQSLNE